MCTCSYRLFIPGFGPSPVPPRGLALWRVKFIDAKMRDRGSGADEGTRDQKFLKSVSDCVVAFSLPSFNSLF